MIEQYEPWHTPWATLHNLEAIDSSLTRERQLINCTPMATTMRIRGIPLLRWATLIFAFVVCIPYLVNKPIVLYSDNSGNHYRNSNQVMEPWAFSPFTALPNMPYPPSVANALAERNSTGYLLGNKTFLEFRPYDNGDVDLRIILIVYDRSESLAKCLASLNEAVFDDPNEKISLEIWLDRSPEGHYDKETYKVAKGFKFAHGAYRVHIQPHHVGIQGQWTNTWRPREGSQEVGLILEDDINVSWYFWRWLKAAHKEYHKRNDISGYSLAHPGMAHETGDWLEIPQEIYTYLYRVICTWGFAPQVTSWRQYQEWFYEKEQDESFLPIVKGILPTEWFLSEHKKGRGRDLWEIWHICFTHNSQPAQYTVLLNTPHEGLLAVNRHEDGLHDSGGTPRDPLCVHWKNEYSDFPENPPKFGYRGQLVLDPLPRKKNVSSPHWQSSSASCGTWTRHRLAGSRFSLWNQREMCRVCSSPKEICVERGQMIPAWCSSKTIHLNTGKTDWPNIHETSGD